MQHVAVIGAGASGLCALRYLSAKPDKFQPVVFEKADCIGGTWVYTDETSTDRHGLPIHSSMYKNLKTNIPKEVMAFPDLPFDRTLPSFVTHEDVVHYLEQYAAKFDLLKYIKLQTLVEWVKPVTNGKKTQWEVTVRDLNNKESGTHTSLFDAIMVCNGHHSVPKIPKLKGQESFEGNILHSHCYRKPEDFKDSTVVCVGAGASGLDIVQDLHKHAQEIYFSHWKGTLPSEFPGNIVQVPTIESILGNTVKFSGGQTCEADHIILCTGYEYTFPFLSKDCRVTINNNTVSPLYKHIIHTDFPTLSFIGLPFATAPFLQIYCQIRFVVAVLEGSCELPSKGEMESDRKRDLQKRLDMGWPHRYTHKMGPLRCKYNFELTQLAGVSPIKPAIQNLHKEVLFQRNNNLWHCKKLNYEIVDDEVWHRVDIGSNCWEMETQPF